jgi:GntR family transcriptional regulator
VRDAASARRLGMNAGSSVFVLTRILKLHGKAVCHEEVRLPASRLKGLTAAVIKQHECMLYSMYETRFGMRVLHAEERLKAVTAPREIAALLQLSPGMPMLQIDRIAFTYRHEPAELRHCLCDTRFHHYRNSITG